MMPRYFQIAVLVLTLVCLGCKATPEEQAMEAIESVGGSVRTNSQGQVISVDLSDTPANDHVLTLLAALPHVETLNCTNATHIKGSGLAALHGLTHLDTLYLVNTELDDAGLAHVAHLTSLKTLQIGHTKITDAGMPALDDLAQLQTLSLAGTAVTDRGLVRLRDLRNLSTLILRDTKTTKRGLQELHRMLPELRVVD